MSDLTPPIHSTSGQHAVAIPFPGRGHINPMLHFCSLLVTKRRRSLHITIIVTQEWLDLITSDNNAVTKQQNITFLTVPNVIPSEHVRGYDHPGFLESVLRDMPAPVEQVLNTLYQTTHQPPPDIIIADTFLTWAVNLGSNHGIPVASFWSMCGSVLSILFHRDLILNNPRFSLLNLSDHGRGEEEITSIPGINSIKLKEVPDMLFPGMERTRRAVIEAMECLPKAQFLILRTMEELEESAIAALRGAVSGVPVYPIGPAIPYYKHKNETIEMSKELPEYLAWLNGQAERSVLYVSLGSFVAVSKEQIDELADGLKASGKRVLWVARDEAERLGSEFGERGMVVKWCDQMRVLLNSAVGGFLTHCGWNSTLESAFAGVPVLAWPLTADQPMDCKIMVDDWGIGWRLNKGGAGIVKKSEVCDAVKRFMDLGSEERRIVDENSRKLKKKVGNVVGEDGSTSSVQAFLEKAFK